MASILKFDHSVRFFEEYSRATRMLLNAKNSAKFAT